MAHAVVSEAGVGEIINRIEYRFLFKQQNSIALEVMSELLGALPSTLETNPYYSQQVEAHAPRCPR